MDHTTTNLSELVESAAESVRDRVDTKPEIAIIFGTGLSGLAKEIDVEMEIPYEEIPHFELSTVEFHTGKLLFGKISGKPVVAMQGRLHYYEGYSMQQITFPVRVMKELGAKILCVSNACGTVNNYIPNGSIMLIDDHINLLESNPLIGPNDEKMGPRFVDMSEPYSQKFIELAEEIARENKIKLYKGVYAAMPGPMLETRAEYKMLRTIGADVVGMSTVPEVIAANHMGMKVLGLSIITDECYPDALEPVDINDIIAAAGTAEPMLTLLLREFIKKVEIEE